MNIRIVGLVVLIALAAGYVKGRADQRTQYLADQVTAVTESVDVTRHEQGDADARINLLEAERTALQSRLDSALERLRQRPARLPEPTRVGCAGATGAELSAEDGEFLVREAARADRLRAALTTCYAHVDDVTALGID